MQVSKRHLKNHNRFWLLFLMIALLLASACEPLTSPPGQETLNPRATIDPSEGSYSQSPYRTPGPTPDLRLPASAPNQPGNIEEPDESLPPAAPTEAPAGVTTGGACVGVDPTLPQAFIEAVRGVQWPACPLDQAGQKLALTYGNANPISRWVYVLAAPFPTLRDGIDLATLEDFWKSGEPAPFSTLLMEKSTLSAFTALWGKPNGSVMVMEADDLLDHAWEDGRQWAILPFEQLQPKWKVMRVDGKGLFDKPLEPAAWPLTIPISITAEDSSLLPSLRQAYAPLVPVTNLDPKKMAAVAVTGVTALVRATAVDMELRGITRPAEMVGDLLRGADILHISNEVPFARDCPDPSPYSGERLIFCSKDSYLELLEYIGTDVVELTGDHLSDWGSAAIDHTLGLYRQLGWPYYGGGENIADAAKSVKFDVNGNRIAFLGCNAKNLGYNEAWEYSPGSLHCDMDKLADQTQALSEQGYNPIVTFQHVEVYTWHPTPQMEVDFQRAAQAGAVIVSGSQAHQPHNMAFDAETGHMIRYGLGNLFFDQFGMGIDTERAFIDLHVFYDNRHVATEIYTVQFFDYSQPVFMEPTPRRDMLRQLFQTSGWQVWD